LRQFERYKRINPISRRKERKEGGELQESTSELMTVWATEKRNEGGSKMKSFKLISVVALAFVWGLFAIPPVLADISIKAGSYDTPLELNLEKTNGEFASTNIKAQVFQRVVENKSHGRIKVKVYPAGQLGDDREALLMTKQGSLEVNAYPANPLPNYVPETLAIQIPYLFRDINVAMEVMGGPEGAELAEVVAKKMGVRVLAWGFEGPYYNFMTTKKKIRVPSDLKGQKIRVIEAPSMIEVVKVAGGTPTPISWTEVYTSLQQGVVDGIETALAYVRMIKLEELLKHINMANFYLGPSNFIVNDKWYQSLPAQDRQLIKEAALKAMTTFHGLSLWGEDLWVDFFRGKGIDVYFPTSAEMEIWKNTLRPHMIQWTKKQVGAEWVDKFLKASERVENELYGN
jgi:C4-dicarboxylate-binding protein DctP